LIFFAVYLYRLLPSEIRSLSSGMSSVGFVAGTVKEPIKRGKDYQNQDLVFCTSIGTPLQPRNVIGRHLKPILCKAFCDGPHKTGQHKVDILWYELRHTIRVSAVECWYQPEDRCREAWNLKRQPTLNVYIHTIPSMQHEAAGDLEKALAG